MSSREVTEGMLARIAADTDVNAVVETRRAITELDARLDRIESKMTRSG